VVITVDVKIDPFVQREEERQKQEQEELRRQQEQVVHLLQN